MTDPGIPDEKVGAVFVHGISRKVMDTYGSKIEDVLADFMEDVKSPTRLLCTTSRSTRA